MNWQPSSVHGWGVYGLHVALNWLREGPLHPVFAQPFEPRLIELDPIRRSIIGALGGSSAQLEAELARARDKGQVALAAPVLHGLGNDLSTSLAYGRYLLTSAQALIGVVFLENTALSAAGLERAKHYDLIVAGSSWNGQILRAHGCDNVTVLMQGVDETAFHAHNRRPGLPDRFLIFSGGKLEYRKGQDLVVRAASQFIARHPDAVLVTAWQSPRAGLAQSLDQSGAAAPMVLNGQGHAKVAAWVRQNGIPESNHLDLGLIPNGQIAYTVRQMDVAVFPNRAEGGTNLVAMECMACGVPVILSRNTGHLDLIATAGEPPQCLTLDDQRPVEQSHGTEGWGESQVDEVITQLEFAYSQRQEALAIGQRGAVFMDAFNWPRQCARLAELTLNLTGS
ncbi:MAG: glycosyltransferase [Gammaproteobacteria bacterium]|nr:glycosyltransferase [Gammaproteobacteria bacterium]